MRLPASEAESDGPNLTPVIDVVFLLLIFFLVATRFDEQERELDTQLPEEAQAEPLSMPPREVVVNVTRDGKYIVMRKEYDEKQLIAYLRQASEKNPGNQAVLIRADSESAWKYGVRVMGICNRLKIKDYRVAVIPKR